MKEVVIKVKKIVKGAIFYAELKITETCNQKYIIPVLILQNNNDTTHNRSYYSKRI